MRALDWWRGSKSPVEPSWPCTNRAIPPRFSSTRLDLAADPRRAIRVARSFAPPPRADHARRARAARIHLEARPAAAPNVRSLLVGRWWSAAGGDRALHRRW